MAQKLQAVLDDQQYILGPHVETFEKNVVQWLGEDNLNAMGVSDGTNALILSLRALGIGAGDEVITPAFSFISSATCILLCGARPRFVDICQDTFSMDPSCVKAAINNKTRAILPVHLFGHAANMKEIKQLAQEHDLFVVEDYAQSFGARTPEGVVGTLGDINATSFYPTKNLGGAGDGGMITTSCEELARKVQALRCHGATDHPYIPTLLGTNSRLDALQAAYLSVRLNYLTADMKKREKIAQAYTQGLSHLSPIILPCQKEGYQHVWNQYTVRIPEKRDFIANKMAERGVPTRIYYPVLLCDLPTMLPFKSDETYPESKQATKDVLSLPIYPGLTEKECDYVLDIFTWAYHLAFSSEIRA